MNVLFKKNVPRTMARFPKLKLWPYCDRLKVAAARPVTGNRGNGLIWTFLIPTNQWWLLHFAWEDRTEFVCFCFALHQLIYDYCIMHTYYVGFVFYRRRAVNEYIINWLQSDNVSSAGTASHLPLFLHIDTIVTFFVLICIIKLAFRRFVWPKYGEFIYLVRAQQLFGIRPCTNLHDVGGFSICVRARTHNQRNVMEIIQNEKRIPWMHCIWFD